MIFYSYDTYTIEQFQIWLRDKYQTIDELNRVWERNYGDFSQISPSSWKWMSIMPEADFMAFRRTAIPCFLKKWRGAVKSVDNRHPLIADNIDSMLTSPEYRGKDDFALKEAVDEIGMSFYPKQVGGCSAPFRRWAALDSFYGASGRQGFYISEMQTHTQAMFNPGTEVDPGELKLWCCEGLAAGAKGLIYWMWRPFVKGMQTLGRGLVDYKNESTPRLEFAEKFSKILGRTGVLSPVAPKAAILYDPDSEIFQKCYTKAYPVDQNIYLDSLCGAYQAMFDLGIPCGFCRLDEIGNYRMVLMTNQIVIGKKTAEILEEYVRGGGVLVCDGKIGAVDESSALNRSLPGGCFQPCLGCEWKDTTKGGLKFTYGGKTYSGYYSREEVVLTDGECAGEFEDKIPAVVVKNSGKGRVITVNTHLWYGYFKRGGKACEFLAALAEEWKLLDCRITSPLKVRLAENQRDRFAFIFNYTDQIVRGHISGCGFDEDVTVGACDVKILETRRDSLGREG